MTSRTETIEAIEEDLSRSREELRENVSALSERLTLGQIIDDFVFDGRVDWGKVGSRAADASKIVVPGALLGAGVALLAYQGVNLIPGAGRKTASSLTRGKRNGAYSAYDPGYDPEAERVYYELEEIERLYPRRDEETELDWHDRVAHRHATVLGYDRREGEEDHSFRDRLREGVRKAKEAGRTARRRIAETATHTFQSGKEMAGSAMHAASSSVKAAGAGVKSAAEDVAAAAKAQTERAVDLFQANPVLGVAVGIGLGALLGAALPVTRQERKMLAKPVDEAMARAAEVGERLADKAERTSERVHEVLAKKSEQVRDQASEIANADASSI